MKPIDPQIKKNVNENKLITLKYISVDRKPVIYRDVK